MTLLLVYLFLSLSISFLCSLLEAVLLSSTPAYIAVAVKTGKKYGLVLQQLKSKIDRPLAAILTLNTVAHTVGAAGVGAQVLKIYGDSYVAAASGVMTILILVTSEIFPKTWGAIHWKSLAPFATYTIRALIYFTYPFVYLSELLYKLLSKGKEKNITREEMIVTAEMGVVEGTLRQKESTIIRNLLMLDNIKVSDIMTPRSVMSALDADMSVGQIMKDYKPIRFSRIPVYREDLDHIEGMVHRYKVLEAYSHDQDHLSVTALMTPIGSIPENFSVAAALDQFIKQGEHIFVVVDDYGTTSGLVSLEDAIETLLGVEIVDEFDSVADMRQYALDLWRERKSKQQAKLPAAK